MMTTLLQTSCLLSLMATAYRVRGSGRVSNLMGRLIWSFSVGVFVQILTEDIKSSILCALSAYCGQLISHGESYRLTDGNRDIGPWFSISFLRATLLCWPLGFHMIPCLLISAIMVFINWLSLAAETRKTIQDMLVLAEPLQGLWYGVLLFLCIFRG